MQYNDFVGTAAADISDYYLNNMDEYLTKKYAGFDPERYSCRGCSLFTTYNSSVCVKFICYDKEEGKFVSFIPEEQIPIGEFFNMFKRLEVVIGKGIESISVDDNNCLKLI